MTIAPMDYFEHAKELVDTDMRKDKHEARMEMLAMAQACALIALVESVRSR